MVNTDDLFRFTVYLISIYLIFKKGSKPIRIVGVIILLSHIYKDINNISKWPVWSELIGILLGLILINEGSKLCNLFIITLGLIKSLTHLRQFFLRDNKYY